jgi:Insect cuticle protein
LKVVGGVSVFVIQGTFSFTGSNGKIYQYSYSADENGYKQSEKQVTGREEGFSVGDRIDENLLKTLVGG